MEGDKQGKDVDTGQVLKWTQKVGHNLRIQDETY